MYIYIYIYIYIIILYGTLPKLLVTEWELFKYHSGVPELSQNVPKSPPEETLGVPKGHPKGYPKNAQKVPTGYWEGPTSYAQVWRSAQ